MAAPAKVPAAAPVAAAPSATAGPAGVRQQGCDQWKRPLNGRDLIMLLFRSSKLSLQHFFAPADYHSSLPCQLGVRAHTQSFARLLHTEDWNADTQESVFA